MESPEPASAPADTTARSPRRRRRLPWLIGIGGVLAVGLVGVLLVAGTLRPDRNTPDLAFVAEQELITSAFPDEGDGDRRWGHHRPFGPGPWAPGWDEDVVVGTVAGSGANELTVVPDGGAQTTIPTDEDTRFRGADNHELSDLDAGERVVVRLDSDGTAVVIGVVRGQVMGTVTSLDGDRATVVRPDGLAVQVDLAGVADHPAAGTMVAIQGTAEDAGRVLRAEEVKTTE